MLGYKYRRLTRPTLKCHEARKAQHSLSGAGGYLQRLQAATVPLPLQLYRVPSGETNAPRTGV